MTEIETLLTRVRMTAGHLAPVLLMPKEATALVAEVERLRAEHKELREWAEHLEGAHQNIRDSALAEGIALGKLQERDAAVKLLDRKAAEWEGGSLLSFAADLLLDGEHHRTETT